MRKSDKLDIPYKDGPADVTKLMKEYIAWFEGSSIPKLLIYADPGAIISPKQIDSMIARFPHLETHFVGVASHFLQEDHPHKVGRAIQDWRCNNDSSSSGLHRRESIPGL